jgi:hypothetical protein
VCSLTFFTLQAQQDVEPFLKQAAQEDCGPAAKFASKPVRVSSLVLMCSSPCTSVQCRTMVLATVVMMDWEVLSTRGSHGRGAMVNRFLLTLLLTTSQLFTNLGRGRT